MTVDLPAQVHQAPAEELGVAIDEVAITPESLDALGNGTVSIEIVPEQVIAAVEAEQAEAAAIEAAEAVSAIPALPDPHVPMSRRGRRYAPPTEEFVYEPYLKPRPGKPAEPEGFWPELVHGLTFTLVNLGDSAAVRDRKELEARIAEPVEDTARFIPVISRKGGVGATTVTTLLGMALADVRTDGVLAVDAHPDRGTLVDRVADDAPASVRDVVRRAHRIHSADDMAELVASDPTSLDVLASDTDPEQNRPFDGRAYDAMANVVERFYSVVLTDGASGVLEPAMHAALKRADSIVVVSGGSPEEARLASETVDWLEANDLGDLARNAVVAINTSTTGTDFNDLPQIEAHFRARVRDVVRIPYDEELAAGNTVRYGALRPYTRQSARDLAALVMDASTASRADTAA